MAFITNKKSPKVKNVIGSDKMVRTGFTIAFKKASTTAIIKAVIKRLKPGDDVVKNGFSAMVTPFNKYDVISTARAETIILMIKCMMLLLYIKYTFLDGF